MTAGFLQLLQIDGSALPANNEQYHPWNVLGIGEFNCWLGLHRGIFSASGWGFIVATVGAGGRVRSLPQQVWRTLRVLRLRTDGNCP